MKKTLKFLVIALALAMSVMITASAASYTSLADDLKDIGMFTGTDVGYELDREPTRAEAAVMLVRMLGEEENAEAALEAGTISCPFTDVPDWADAQIAYLYTNSLANGISETAFGTSTKCSAQMYCTYLLRVLGYSDKDGGDFTYDGALDFAAQIGLADSVLLAGTFTRDSLVAVSYQALATDVKETDGNLLSKLIEDGAIDADAAKSISTKLDAFDTINAASDEFDTSLDADMTMDLTMTMDEETITLNDVATSIKLNITDDSIEAAIVMTTTDPQTDEPMNITEWIKDGWIYIDDGTNKSKMELDYSDMLSTIEDSTINTEIMPIYCYTDLSVASEDGATTYTMSIASEYLTAAVADVLEQTLSEADSMNIEFSDVTMDYTFNEDGALTDIGMMIDMSMSYMDVDVAASLSYDMTIISSGDSVTIDFPDFSDFTEITE